MAIRKVFATIVAFFILTCVSGAYFKYLPADEGLFPFAPHEDKQSTEAVDSSSSVQLSELSGGVFAACEKIYNSFAADLFFISSITGQKYITLYETSVISANEFIYAAEASVKIGVFKNAGTAYVVPAVLLFAGGSGFYVIFVFVILMFLLFLLALYRGSVPDYFASSVNINKNNIFARYRLGYRVFLFCREAECA